MRSIKRGSTTMSRRRSLTMWVVVKEIINDEVEKENNDDDVEKEIN